MPDSTLQRPDLRRMDPNVSRFSLECVRILTSLVGEPATNPPAARSGIWHSRRVELNSSRQVTRMIRMPSRRDIAGAEIAGRSAARPALLALKTMRAMMITTIPSPGAEFTRAP